jgi:dynein heavy chain
LFVCSLFLLQEIENAVEDVVKTITTYPMDSHIDRVPREEVEKLKKHYNNFMYQALLHCTKRSLGAIKTRVGSRLSGDFLYVERPIFEVDVQVARVHTQCSIQLVV